MPRKAAGTTRKSRTSASRPLRRARSTRRVLNDSAARTLTSLQSDNIQNEKAGEDPERNDDSRGVNDSDPSSGLLSYLHQRRHPSKHGKEEPEADPDQEVHHEEFQVGPEGSPDLAMQGWRHTGTNCGLARGCHLTGRSRTGADSRGPEETTMRPRFRDHAAPGSSSS